MSTAKKCIALMMAIAMVCTVFAGCSSSGGGAATTTAATATTKAATTTTAAAPVQETPVSLSYVGWNCGTIEPGNEMELYVEEKLNLDLEMLKVDLSNAEQKNLMLASGDMPDCAWLFADDQDLYQQGIIRTIKQDQIRQYAPNYAAQMDANPLGWKISVLDGTTDEYMSLSGYQYGKTSSLMQMTAYRLDWLETIGVSPKGEVIEVLDRVYMATEPFTKSEFLDIAEKFTTGDPDGNGEDDTYGLVSSVNGGFWLGMLYGMHNISTTGAYYDTDGVAKPYYVTEAYKDILRTLNTLYVNGWMDQEYATLDFWQASEKATTGKGGIFGVASGWITAADWVQTRPPMSVLNNNPDAKILLVPSETNDDGIAGHAPYGMDDFSGAQFFINYQVDDEKLAKALEFFDFINYDEEAKFKLQYGDEGVHFEWGEPEIETCPVYLEGVEVGGTTGLATFQSGYVADRESLEKTWDKPQWLIQDYCYGDFTKYLKLPDKYDLFGETNLSELNSNYGATINTIVSEYQYAVVSGEKELDASWEEYVGMLEQSGLGEIIEAWNSIPDYSTYSE